MLAALPFDIFVTVSGFLSPDDIINTVSTCKSLYTLRDSTEVWKMQLSGLNPKVVSSLRAHLVHGSRDTATVSKNQLIELARQASRLDVITKVCWRKPPYLEAHRAGSEFRLERMEAHTMSAFLSRYLIIVGGWASARENHIDIIDGAALPERLVVVPTVTENVPVFRYGFSSVVHNNSVYVFGGCKNGGYSGDCSDLYQATLQFSEDADASTASTASAASLDWSDVQYAPIGKYRRVVASYSSNLTRIFPRNQDAGRSSSATASRSPISRAYHSAAVIRHENEDFMVVFGGLHGQSPTDSLEVLRFRDNRWFSPTRVVGQPPLPRFGHSCLVAPNGDMIITGGSNGNDLWRNGREYREIYVLALSKGLVGAAEQQEPQFIWTKLALDPTIAPSVPGRCHAAASIGDTMMYFGGGANISDALVALKYAGEAAAHGPSSDEAVSSAMLSSSTAAATPSTTAAATTATATDRMRSVLYHPRVARSHYRPSVRTSVAAAVIGPYFCMFGGWNKSRREMGDFWVLDLTTGKKAAPRSTVTLDIANALTTTILELDANDQTIADDAEEDDDEVASGDDDDDDNDELDEMMMGGGGGFINNVPIGAIFQAMLSQGLDFIPALQLVQAMRGDASLLFGGDGDGEDDENGVNGGEEDDAGDGNEDEDEDDEGGPMDEDDDYDDDDDDDGDEDDGDEDESGEDDSREGSEASSLPGLEEIVPPINRDEYDQLLSDDDTT